MIQPLRQRVFRNFGIKIASMLLAMGVYAHVYSQQVRETVLEIPLSVSGLPRGLTYRGEVPAKASLRVRGRGIDLLKLRSQAPRAIVHLSSPHLGRLERPVTTGDVLLPPQSDVVVEEVLGPSALILQIEEVESASLPVVVTTRGRPARGAILYGAPRAWPDTVGVQGPVSLISKMDSIRTEDVDLEGRSESVGESVRLRLPEGVKAGTERVSVRVPIVPLDRRSFGPLPLSLPAEMREGWAVRPKSVTVSVSGPRPAIESMSLVDIRVRVLPSSPPTDGDTLGVQVFLPARLRANVAVESVDPSTVVLVRGSH